MAVRQGRGGPLGEDKKLPWAEGRTWPEALEEVMAQLGVGQGSEPTGEQ